MRLKFLVVPAVVLISVGAFAGRGYAVPPSADGPVSKDVGWTIGKTTVSATITIPGGHGPYPAVVLVAGSGPTDRDWNSKLMPGTNGSARLLAEELSGDGLVVLRYDKRFLGPNAAGNMVFLAGKLSLQSHVEELAGAVALLSSRKEVDPKQIFALSNSESAIHALNYQSQKEPKFAGLVLTAPPGRRLKELLRSQIGAQAAPLPNAAEIMGHYDNLIESFLAGRPFIPDPVVPQDVNVVIKSFHHPHNLPLARELLNVEPGVLLGGETSPTLVLIGKKDIQVDWRADGAVLEKAAHGNVSFAYPENANHVLKHESKPRSELSAADGAYYNAPDKVLDTETLNVILDWFKGHTLHVIGGSGE